MMIKNSNFKKSQFGFSSLVLWVRSSGEDRGPTRSLLLLPAPELSAVLKRASPPPPSSSLPSPLLTLPSRAGWCLHGYSPRLARTHAHTHTHSGNLWATSRLLGEEEEKKKSLEKQKSVGSNRVKLSGHGEAVRVKLLRVPV